MTNDPRLWRGAGLLAIGAALGGLFAAGAVGWAQPGFHDAVYSPQTRAEMYASLAEDAAELEQRGSVLKKIAKLVNPAVVHIDAESSQPQGGYFRPSAVIEEAGSGVLIDLDGATYVLTNRHVIKDHDTDQIKIKLFDRREITPVKTWEDPMTDVAIMRVDEPNLIVAPMGDSDHLEIGDFVLAAGSPFGLSRSITFGIVSALGRRDLKLGADGVHYQDFIQTDAAINPGNSGGPLINLRGEVVGINTAIASNSGGNEGIGFSIPSNMVMTVARQLVDKGNVARAFLGVQWDRDFGAADAARLGLPRPVGARIVSLTADAPAETAGLQVDDVILRFNGTPIEDGEHLYNVVGLTEVNIDVPVVIWRDRATEELKIRVGDRMDFPH